MSKGIEEPIFIENQSIMRHGLALISTYLQ